MAIGNGIDLGVAYIGLTVSTATVPRDVRKGLKSVPAIGSRIGNDMGRRMSGGITSHLGNATKKSLKVISGGIAGLGAAVIGMAAKGGLNRALNIDDARRSLEGLGYDTKKIDRIMDSALTSVKGTAFGLGDAAQIASTAVAAGIEPGKDLTRTLTLTANSAALARTGLGEMGSILNKVWTAGRVQTQELNELSDRGIPIWTKLAEHYKVSGIELRKMVERGKVDAGTFASVLEGTVGNASQTMGKGIRGTWQNMQAAFSRTGEKFLNGVLPIFKNGFNGITGLLDNITPKVGEFGASFGKWITGSAIPALTKLGSWFGEHILPALREFGTVVGGALKDSFGRLSGFLSANATSAQSFGTSLGGIVVGSIRTFGTVLATTITTLTNVGSWVVKNKDWLSALAVSVGVVVGVYKAWMFATQAWTTITRVAAAAQIFFNTVIRAHPIGIIITAITALVAGLVWFFTKTKTGQAIIQAAWSGIKTAIGAVVSWTQTYVMPVLTTVWNGIKTGFNLLVTVVKVIMTAVLTSWKLTWMAVQAVYSAIIRPAVNGIVTVFKWLWTQVNRFVVQPFILGWKLLGAAFVTIKNRYLTPTINGIKTAFQIGWQFISRTVFAPMKLAWNGLGVAFNWVKNNLIMPAWNGLRAALGNGWAFVRNNVFTPLKNAWSAVGSGFSSVKNNVIMPAWNGLRSALSSGWSFINKSIFGPLKKGVSAIGSAFTAARGVIEAAWNKIKDAAIRPVNFIIKTVYMDKIKGTWDKVAKAVGIGFNLPEVKGFARGTEDHRAQIARGGAMRLWAEPETGGEAYIPLAKSKRPRSLRILGNVANAFGHQLLPFKNGGIQGWAGDTWDSVSKKTSSAWNSTKKVVKNVTKTVKDTAKQAWDWGKNAAETTARFLANPVGALKDLIADKVSALASKVGGGDFGRMAFQLPLKAVDGLVNKVKGLVAEKNASMAPGLDFTPAPGVNAAGIRPGMGWQAMWALVRQAFPSATLTSAYRPGAVTAGYGTPSLHGQGRAIDITPSMAIFEWIRKVAPGSTELIFTPAGTRQLSHGHSSLFNAVTAANHVNHIHWGMSGGGLVRGKGTSTSDSIHTALSTGEFVVNAVATARNLPLLQALNAGLDFQAAGVNAVAGLATGISGSTAVVTSAIRGIATDTVDAFTDELEIHSPSRIFARVAAYIPAGMKKGLLANAKSVYSGLTSITKQITKASAANIKAVSDRIYAAYKKAGKKISKAQAVALSGRYVGHDTGRANKANKILFAQRSTTQSLWRQGDVTGARWLADAFTKTGRLNAHGRGNATLRNATLADIAKARQVIQTQIKGVQAKLKDLRAQWTQMRDSVASTIRGELDLSAGLDTSTTNEWGYTTGAKKATFASVAGQVSSLAAKAKSFAGKLNLLNKKGIPTGLIQEVAGLGTEKGIPVADALLSGTSAQVKSLAASYSSLNAWSKKAGSYVADSAYGVGIAAQEGILKGLTANDAKLAKAAQVLANNLTKAVKKTLGIRSPSRRFRYEIGRQLVPGIIGGVDDSQPLLDRRMSRLVDPGQVDTRALERLNIAPPVLSDPGPVRLDADLAAGGLGGVSDTDLERLVAMLVNAISGIRVDTTVAVGKRESASIVRTGIQEVKRNDKKILEDAHK